MLETNWLGWSPINAHSGKGLAEQPNKEYKVVITVNQKLGDLVGSYEPN